MSKYLLIGGVFALCWLGLAACGGSTDDDNTGGTTVRVTPGGACEPLGATAPSIDGCNTCSCTQGSWACTKRACTGACEEGASRPAGDGCNTCTCNDGQWGCTLMGCADPPVEQCPEPRAAPPDVVCAQVVVYARSPDTGLCCEYGSACVAPEAWHSFDTREECERSVGCVPGETKPAGDGCNSCSCTEQGWVCTLMPCVSECVAGETRPADDGCNVCSCVSDGQWACTEKACPPPTYCGARAGDTCAGDEYCAYVEGQYCGAADAEATCQKRPQVCAENYDPVCGCDGQTHGNACAAAVAGTGVLHDGACTN